MWPHSAFLYLLRNLSHSMSKRPESAARCLWVQSGLLGRALPLKESALSCCFSLPPLGLARGLLSARAVLTPAPGPVCMFTLLSHLLHPSLGTPRTVEDVCDVENPRAWGLHHSLAKKPGEAGSGQSRVIVHFEWSGSQCTRVQLSQESRRRYLGPGPGSLGRGTAFRSRSQAKRRLLRGTNSAQGSPGRAGHSTGVQSHLDTQGPLDCPHWG